MSNKQFNLTGRKVELLETLIEFAEVNWSSFCAMHEERTGTDEFLDDDLSELSNIVHN